MNQLLQALMGGYQPGEMHALMQAGLANHPEHEIDPMILAQAEMDVLGGGGGAPHGYGAGAGYGQLNPNDVAQNGSQNGGMVRSSKSWQPPMWSGGAPAAEEPVDMPQVDVVPGYSLRGKYPEPGARAGWLDDGRQVSPSDFSRFAGKGDGLDRLQQQGMGPGGPFAAQGTDHPVPNSIQQMIGGGGNPSAPWGGMGPQQPGGGNSLAQALGGGMPQQDDGFNRYLPGMPSEAERNQNVMLNARARKESRLARMGEVSPTMLGMFDQMADSGGGGGMNPLMARMMGGPQGFNTALQNQGLMDRTQMMLGPQQMEAEARLRAANSDAEFKQWMMTDEGREFALQRAGKPGGPAVPGSREWMITMATKAPDYATFENIIGGVAPEAVGQARQIWMETKMQDPTAPPAPSILDYYPDAFKTSNLLKHLKNPFSGIGGIAPHSSSPDIQ